MVIDVTIWSACRHEQRSSLIPTSEPLLAAEAVVKRFGANTVLHGVDLELAAGESTCIIGPSGSGKTTLLRCMALLEVPSDGRVVMNGATVAQADLSSGVRAAAKKVRPEIGMVFQQFNLWPHMTVLQNIIEAPLRVRGLNRDEAIATGEGLLEKVGLAAKRDPIRPGCPVASSSASRLRVRWRCSPRCSCSTSRHPRSTPNCAAKYCR